MKNKRREHGKIIEKFQEKSQQAEVTRHDLIDTMEVSGILEIFWTLDWTFYNKNLHIFIESIAKVNWQRD